MVVRRVSVLIHRNISIQYITDSSTLHPARPPLAPIIRNIFPPFHLPVVVIFAYTCVSWLRPISMVIVAVADDADDKLRAWGKESCKFKWGFFRPLERLGWHRIPWYHTGCRWWASCVQKPAPDLEEDCRPKNPRVYVPGMIPPLFD